MALNKITQPLIDIELANVELHVKSLKITKGTKIQTMVDDILDIKPKDQATQTSLKTKDQATQTPLKTEAQLRTISLKNGINVYEQIRSICIIYMHELN